MEKVTLIEGGARNKTVRRYIRVMGPKEFVLELIVPCCEDERKFIEQFLSVILKPEIRQKSTWEYAYTH